MPTDTDDQRAKFEAWAKSQYYFLSRDKYGGYASVATHAAWAAWQAALATPPAQGVEPGVFVVDAAIQDVSDEAVSLTAKRLRESGLPNVAQIMLTLSALLNGARTALAAQEGTGNG